MLKKIALALAAVAAFSTAAVAGDPMVGGAPMYASRTIIQNAIHSKDHTTLVAAVKAAGLVKTLEGKGPFTVFAPTNEAFEALPKGTVRTLLEPRNRAVLRKILTCHVVAGDLTSGRLEKQIKMDGGHYRMKTVGGCRLTAMEKGGKFMIKDERGDVADVTIPDVMQSNGVIQVINKVLLPKH